MTKKLPKFTKRERAKVKLVLESLRARLEESLKNSGSCYDNDLGCGNCGDTGPFHGTLTEVEVLVGLRDKNYKLL
jgi:hypothetical protein